MQISTTGLSPLTGLGLPSPYINLDSLGLPSLNTLGSPNFMALWQQLGAPTGRGKDGNGALTPALLDGMTPSILSPNFAWPESTRPGALKSLMDFQDQLASMEELDPEAALSTIADGVLKGQSHARLDDRSGGHHADSLLGLPSPSSLSLGGSSQLYKGVHYDKDRDVYQVRCSTELFITGLCVCTPYMLHLRV